MSPFPPWVYSNACFAVCHICSTYQRDNLIFDKSVDRGRFVAAVSYCNRFRPTEDVVDRVYWLARGKVFGWCTKRTNGHQLGALSNFTEAI